MQFITLLTDFGLREGYVGVMKGVIWRIAPEVQIADISHLIGPQDIMEGSLALGRSVPYFPVGTIHVGVVDPGVGTNRRPMAAWLGDRFFVGPDNGLVTVILEQARQKGLSIEAVHLDQKHYWLPKVSNVFHGRDIFAPVAAHLAKGVPLGDLGTPIKDIVEIPIPKAEPLKDGCTGQIAHIDHFGNIATNIPQELVEKIPNPVVRVGDVEISGIVQTFGSGRPGELVALFGSTHDLVVAVVDGDAAARLKSKVGDPVTVRKGRV